MKFFEIIRKIMKKKSPERYSEILIAHDFIRIGSHSLEMTLSERRKSK